MWKLDQLARSMNPADPGNAGWQRDLSVSHTKIGDCSKRRATVRLADSRREPGGKTNRELWEVTLASGGEGSFCHRR
jgi:hypothetical protein